jgi:hypothetical protein
VLSSVERDENPQIIPKQMEDVQILFAQWSVNVVMDDERGKIKNERNNK